MEATKYYKLSAEQGNLRGQYHIGYCYENGLGVSKDLNEARRWYNLAAEQGDSDAKKGLQRLKS